jgi:hypothetical protein
MLNETKELPVANYAPLYREWPAEHEETLTHKWHETGRAGRDIGFEQALADWIIKHRSHWRTGRQPESQLDLVSTS